MKLLLLPVVHLHHQPYQLEIAKIIGEEYLYFYDAAATDFRNRFRRFK